MQDFPIEQIQRFRESQARDTPDFLKVNVANMHHWIQHCKQNLPSKVDLVTQFSKPPTIMEWTPWTPDTWTNNECIQIHQQEFKHLEIVE